MTRKILTYTLLSILLTACSTTRYIPEGEQLYTGIKSMNFVDSDKNAETQTGETALDEVTYALDYAPNGSLFGSSTLKSFPVGLWFYNAFYESKDAVGKWLFNSFSTAPVLISKVTPALRAEVATDILKYYGYFNGKVESTINTNKKNPKKASVSYKITFNTPAVYDSINYLNFPPQADSIIHKNLKRTHLKVGDQFNAAAMEEERTRISTLLRNNGYYNFQPGYIIYLADTLQKQNKVNLRVQSAKNIPDDAYNTYRIGNINLKVLDSSTEQNIVRHLEADTASRGGMKYIYYNKKVPVRWGALMSNIQLRRGELYSQKKQQRAMQMLAQMNIFSNVNLNMTPNADNTIDVDVTAQLDKPYDFTFELNATSKSNSQIGPGSKISLAKKNVFRSAETLKMSLTGSYEWQTDKNVKGRAATINSWEIGADVSLSYPRLFLPGIKRRYLRVHSTTSFRLYADQMNRSGFFRMMHAGGDATYKIFGNNRVTHTAIPFRLTYDMLLSTTEKFDSIAKHNRSIQNSFRNQFIPAMQYTFTYDESATKIKNKTWVETSLTSAGNVTSLAFWAFGKKLDEKNKNIFGNPYAQFIKLTLEARQLWHLSTNHNIAMRLMSGAIHSYGNSEYPPYSELFYIGGANSLRAFTVRSVGPGSYRPSSNDRYSYLDETGTFKLEMNVEYRFRIVADLHGALFVDAGNIWLLKKDPERPGGELRLKNFAEQIALNTGLGVRYDLSFLVLRVDFGLGLHAPYNTGRKGYFNLNPIKDGFAWHFAIGYPF